MSGLEDGGITYNVVDTERGPVMVHVDKPGLVEISIGDEDGPELLPEQARALAHVLLAAAELAELARRA